MPIMPAATIASLMPGVPTSPHRTGARWRKVSDAAVGLIIADIKPEDYAASRAANPYLRDLRLSAAADGSCL